MKGLTDTQKKYASHVSLVRNHLTAKERAHLVEHCTDMLQQAHDDYTASLLADKEDLGLIVVQNAFRKIIDLLRAQ